ncbi:phosphosulfolactate synthase [Streptosporangium sp. NBC_01755]|uniref:phosphosulfolactate synthase n=1 Tax=unclassified Streptosporangium TaxID=2632669 RepID=UPI002DD8343B|nr:MULTISPECIES: phosphosulfolactate synthase [unclassified Streptosporangium]WSA26447.1 phosphosulfolactate synthase [Streptosporangium sp. NBC_01810]WSD02123.1 phosphosulfolactate synthase [Streptosporangium sp. NBC_01755]
MTGQPSRDRTFPLDLTAAEPDFLTLPPRTEKPRRHGVSHVLDNGMSVAEVEQRLKAAAASIDLWKFGWGTAYIDSSLGEKLELLAEHQVLACTGGTLLEISWQRGVVDRFMDWAESVGFPCVEVSCGSVEMSRADKDKIIDMAASRFVVLSEIGLKDPDVAPSAGKWAADARADLRAGAHWVVTEGRESGTVGLFNAEGRVRADIVDAVVSAVGLEATLFEAPRRAQQAWLIRRYGANVNLGNIQPAEALAVETLRLGLRSDTIGTFSQLGEVYAGVERP